VRPPGILLPLLGGPARFHRLDVPSADSPYAMGSPCGSLTRAGWLTPRLLFCVLLPFRGLARRLSRREGPSGAGGVWGDRFPPLPVIYGNQSAETHGTSRGELRLLSAHDRQIYVVGHATDRGLRPVLRTRPGHSPPHLPALHLLGAGHTCSSTRAFASGLLQARIAVAPLPSWTLPGRRVNLPDSII